VTPPCEHPRDPLEPARSGRVPVVGGPERHKGDAHTPGDDCAGQKSSHPHPIPGVELDS
jgi:hypothetical protein